MFCKNCGETVEEGHSFCKNCGAPVLAVEAPSEIGPPSPTPTPTPAPPPSSASGAAGPPQTPSYGVGWQPPQGPTGPRNRGALIAGIVAAVVIVLAGAGVGVYFGVYHGRDGDNAGNGGTAGTVTTLTASTLTASTLTGNGGVPSSGPGVPSSGPGVSTTGGGTITSVPGNGTTQTIPSLTTSAGGETSTTRRPTTTIEDLYGSYLAASDMLVGDLTHADRRIPELATVINDTLPNVPVWVRDELQSLLDTLGDDDWELGTMLVPVEHEVSFSWLEEAMTHMVARIQATIQGIEVMWNTGQAASSTSYFNTGRAERDAYRTAFEKYRQTLPAD